MGGLKQLLRSKDKSSKEIDPEDSYHSIDARPKKSQNETEQDDIKKIMGSRHLESKIPIESDSIHHKKYAGRLVTVQDWMKTDTNNPFDSGKSTSQIKKAKRRAQEGDSLDEGQEDDDEDHSDDAEQDDEEEEEDNDDDEEDDEEEEDEEDEDEEDDDDDQDEVNEQDEDRVEENSSTQSSTSTSDPGDDRNQSKKVESQEQPSDLIKQLKVSAKADIEKAKAVKNQLSMYDRLLAVRIGMQKSLVATNKLVEMKHEMGADNEEQDNNVKQKAQIAIDELLEIGSKIGALRAIFMEPIDGEPPSKRQKNNHDATGERSNTWRDCLEEADQLDKRLSPYLRTTVRKWSTKINSTAAINSKKFDSTSRQQNMMDLLEKIWSSKDEKDKLILRSRTNRQGQNPSTTKNSNNTDDPLSPSIFEDRDFYLSLLKDVVDSASRKQDLAEETIGNNDYRSHRVHRVNVDPRATKGRKIQYNTHEKLISVMVPIQNELWTDVQKDELFASLFGFGFENTDQSYPEFSLFKSDSFKLF